MGRQAARGGTKNETNAGPHHPYARLRTGRLILGSSITQEFATARLGIRDCVTSTERAEEDMT